MSQNHCQAQGTNVFANGNSKFSIEMEGCELTHRYPAQLQMWTIQNFWARQSQRSARRHNQRRARQQRNFERRIRRLEEERINTIPRFYVSWEQTTADGATNKYKKHGDDSET